MPTLPEIRIPMPEEEKPLLLQGYISNNPVKRPLARNIGRALLPKRVENWFLGSQEDEDLLNKYSDNDIPTYDEINENYKSGLYNKNDLINYSNLRNQYEQARANRDYTDVRNANIGQGIVDIGSAAIGGGGATATKAGVNLLRPWLGKKIALQTTQGLLGGGLGGAAHGFGTGLVQEDVNPFTQGLIEGGIGLGTGGTLGLGIGQVGKKLAFNSLYKNDGIGLGKILNGDETKFANYFDDYVSGLKGDPEFITDFSQLPAVGERTLFDNANTNLRLARQGVRPRATTTEGQYNFIGENAFIDKGKLGEAQQMAMYGDSNADIRNATGWFKGVDGKWRYEIPDGKMIDNPKLVENFDEDIGTYYTGKLSDIYDAPELYQAYPQLANRDIVIQSMPEGYGGSSWGDSISINRNYFQKDNPEFLKLKAELENTPEYKKYDLAFNTDTGDAVQDLANMDKAQKEFFDSDIGKQYHSLMWDKNYPIERKVQGFNDDALKTLVHETQHQIQGIEGFARGGSGENPDYWNLAGEVEARLAGARAKLTPEQRQIYNPANESSYLTNYGYDVIPEKQIVEFRNNKSDLYNKLINNDDLTPEQLAAKLKAKAAEMRRQKTTYAKGENMTAATMNQLMRNGSDIPPIDFTPKDVIIRNKTYKEIWLDNQKQISSSFIERLASKNKNTKYMKMPLSDGFTYYAHIKDGSPVFYKRVRTK